MRLHLGQPPSQTAGTYLGRSDRHSANHGDLVVNRSLSRAMQAAATVLLVEEHCHALLIVCAWHGEEHLLTHLKSSQGALLRKASEKSGSQ